MGDVAPGALVAGRYRVERLLGSGSVKHVHLALDVLTRRRVAVSLLHASPDRDPTIGPRFSREARAAAAIDSPFVVRVLDVGKLEDGTRYMVTEAVLGRGLDAAIERGPCPPLAAARWTAQVLAGLAEAHRRGVLHRDVKPENVLLEPSAGDPVGEVARLTDFGLAKVLDAQLEGSVALRTAQGVVMGTPDYMAPEQWQALPLDARADVYSAGAMFYELLAGKAPFEGPSLREYVAQHHFHEVPALPEGVHESARAFEAVVRRALAKRASERFPSADAMREAIESIGGFRLAAGDFGAISSPPVEDDEPLVRAEIVTDVGAGPFQLVVSPRVVLGRTGHVVVRCVPISPENDRRTRTLSRRHARVEWRGGTAWLVDLQSRSGTRVDGRAAPRTAPGVALKHGAEIALGPHVRFLFEHAPAAHGVLPAWARFTRTDPHGAGLVHVVVLTEATVGGGDADAIRLPAEAARGESLTLRARDGDVVVTARGLTRDAALAEGQVWRVGDARLTVAMERTSSG